MTISKRWRVLRNLVKILPQENRKDDAKTVPTKEETNEEKGANDESENFKTIVTRRLQKHKRKSEIESVKREIYKKQKFIEILQINPFERSDADVAIIQAYLEEQYAFSTFSSIILRELASLVIFQTFEDGSIVHYQESEVNEMTPLYIVLEGSLSAYFNTEFSERLNKDDNFSRWHVQNKQDNKAFDFGECIATYTPALCCEEEILYRTKNTYRLNGVMSQEKTLVLSMTKDMITHALRYTQFQPIDQLLRGRDGKIQINTDASIQSLVNYLRNFVFTTGFSDDARITMAKLCETKTFEKNDLVIHSGEEIDTIWIVLDGILGLFLPYSSEITTNDLNAQTKEKDLMNGIPVGNLKRGQSFGERTIKQNQQERKIRNTCDIICLTNQTHVLKIGIKNFLYLIHIHKQIPASIQQIVSTPFMIETKERTQRNISYLMEFTQQYPIFPFFQQFPAFLQEQLCLHMKYEEYEANEIIYSSSQPSDFMYLIVSGQVKIKSLQDISMTKLNCLIGFHNNEKGIKKKNQLSSEYINPGNCFGYAEIFKKVWRTSTAKAEITTGVLKISNNCFDGCLRNLYYDIVFNPMETLSIMTLPSEERRSHIASLPSFTWTAFENNMIRLFHAFNLFRSYPVFLLKQMLSILTVHECSEETLIVKEDAVNNQYIAFIYGIASIRSIHSNQAIIERMFQSDSFCTMSSSFIHPDARIINSNDQNPALKQSLQEQYGEEYYAIGAGDCFYVGIVEKKNERQSPASIIASSTCLFCTLDGNAYHSLLLQHPPFFQVPAPLRTALENGANNIKESPEWPPHSLIPILERTGRLSMEFMNETVLRELSTQFKCKKFNQGQIIACDEIACFYLIIQGQCELYTRNYQRPCRIPSKKRRNSTFLTDGLLKYNTVVSNYHSTSKQLQASSNQRSLQNDQSIMSSSSSFNPSSYSILRLQQLRQDPLKQEQQNSYQPLHNLRRSTLLSNINTPQNQIQCEKEKENENSPSKLKSQTLSNSPQQKIPLCEKRQLNKQGQSLALAKRRGDLTIENLKRKQKEETYGSFIMLLNPGDSFGANAFYQQSFKTPFTLVAEQNVIVLELSRYPYLNVIRNLTGEKEEYQDMESEVKAAVLKVKWQKAMTHALGTRNQRRTIASVANDFTKARMKITMSQMIQIALFQEMDPQDIEKICHTARFEALRTNTIIYQRGDPSERFYIILSGHVSLHLPNSRGDGDDLRVIDLFSNHFFGEFELLTHQRTRYLRAVVEKETKLVSVPSETFLRIFPKPFIDLLMHKISFLLTFELFKHLDMERITSLYHNMKVAEYSIGSTILSYGEIKHHVYLIMKGECKIEEKMQFHSTKCNDESKVSVNAQVAIISQGHPIYCDGVMKYLITCASTISQMMIIELDIFKQLTTRSCVTQLEQITKKIQELEQSRHYLLQQQLLHILNAYQSENHDANYQDITKILRLTRIGDNTTLSMGTLQGASQKAKMKSQDKNHRSNQNVISTSSGFRQSKEQETKQKKDILRRIVSIPSKLMGSFKNKASDKILHDEETIEEINEKENKGNKEEIKDEETLWSEILKEDNEYSPSIENKQENRTMKQKEEKNITPTKKSEETRSSEILNTDKEAKNNKFITSSTYQSPFRSLRLLPQNIKHKSMGMMPTKTDAERWEVPTTSTLNPTIKNLQSKKDKLKEKPLKSKNQSQPSNKQIEKRSGYQSMIQIIMDSYGELKEVFCVHDKSQLLIYPEKIIFQRRNVQPLLIMNLTQEMQLNTTSKFTNRPNAFDVVTRQKSITLIASSVVEKNRWINSLNYSYPSQIEFSIIGPVSKIHSTKESNKNQDINEREEIEEDFPEPNYLISFG